MSVYSDLTNYLGGYKGAILIVDQQAIEPKVAKYSYICMFGNSVSSTIIYNFGVPTAEFGSIIQNYNCIIGLGTIQFRLLVSPSPPLSILNVESGTDLTNINFNNVNLVRMTVLCLA